MRTEINKLISEAKHEKNIQDRIKKLVALYEKYGDDYKIILELLFAIGQIKEYRGRAKELLLELTYYYDVNQVYFYLAKLEFFDNNTFKAKEYLDDILEDIPNYQPAIFESARIDLITDNEESGKRKLQHLASYHNDGAAYYELGRFAEFKKDYDLAKENYYKSIEINPKDVRAMFKVAKLEKDEGNREVAEKILNSIIEIDNKDLPSLLELGKIKSEKGEFDKARDIFEEILSISEDPAAHMELGMLEETVGNNDEAEKQYLLALKTGNKDYAYIHLGLLHKRLGNYEISKKYFSNVIGKRKVNAVFETVNVELKEGNIDDALAHFIKLMNQENLEKIDSKKIKRTRTYIRYKLGTLNDEKDTDYYANQLLNYDQNRTIEISKNYFHEQMDLEHCFEIVKEKIVPENFNTTTSGCDYYDIELDFPTGIFNGEETNFLAVSTIVNTDKIILMQPTIPKRIKKIYTKKIVR